MNIGGIKIEPSTAWETRVRADRGGCLAVPPSPISQSQGKQGHLRGVQNAVAACTRLERFRATFFADLPISSG